MNSRGGLGLPLQQRTTGLLSSLSEVRGQFEIAKLINILLMRSKEISHGEAL